MSLILENSITTATKVSINNPIKSTTLSTKTVPSNLLIGSLSVLLRITHLVTSPIRGNARFAKYPLQ